MVGFKLTMNSFWNWLFVNVLNNKKPITMYIQSLFVAKQYFPLAKLGERTESPRESLSLFAGTNGASLFHPKMRESLYMETEAA